MQKETSPYTCHVFVCTNDRHGERPSCADGGGNAALKDYLKDQVEKRGWKGRVRVSSGGCMGLCGKGPNVMIYPQKAWFCSGLAGRRRPDPRGNRNAALHGRRPSLSHKVKLPAHRAGLPGKEKTRHDCAPEYLRSRIIHPHPNPLPSREREIRVVIFLRRPRSWVH